ncbi:hypothetical protein Aph01nite_56210 [Acrocarpospora phusangensis]|uniref:Htaa domain-containing protein n=1 Tax=Acrocarpospora phusangensis TaxID=1070424 RepID=A0A919QEE0_9ACTN|nr:hypothetical protein [Acrocarpospora phusangensis]GIH27311.1 hypothetical protein Aph01nite_56210 [Acrocarpospora phusangensis]
MSRLGPVYTLAVGAVLTVALGVASAQASPAVEQATATPIDTASTAPPVEEEAPTPEEEVPNPAETDAPEAAPVDTTPKKVDYAGVVQGNGGLVAISIRNGKAVAYFCDGHIEAWLKGTAANNEVILEGKNALITASLGGGKAKGRVEFKGKSWQFNAAVVKKPSGLYRATAQVRGARIVGGWIKLPSGQSVGRLTIGESGAGEAAAAFDGGVVTWYGIPLTPTEPDAFIDTINP